MLIPAGTKILPFKKTIGSNHNLEDVCRREHHPKYWVVVDHGVYMSQFGPDTIPARPDWRDSPWAFHISDIKIPQVKRNEL